MEWHVGNNPCPHGKPYLMGDSNCYRCPSYQECTSAVEIREECEYVMEDGQCGYVRSSQYLNGCECESDNCPYYSSI